MDISEIQIGDYLESKGQRRGKCKVCNIEVYWTVINLVRHKRNNCTISAAQKTQWPNPSTPVIHQRRNINDYLENKNPLTRRGTCKRCGMQVYWTNIHLTNHKRLRCNISNEEISEWKSNDGKYRHKLNGIKIKDFLENKSASTRKGNCLTCGTEVYWSIQSLAKHKQRKCVESERDNNLWHNIDKLEVFVEPNIETAKEIVLPSETTNEESKKEMRLSSTDIISEYLKDKNPLTRRGTCRVCLTRVFWTMSHLLFHKLRKCQISESKKLYWINLQKKLTEAKNSREDEFNIGDYLTDKNTITRRGTCKVCHKRVYWATLHLASHKKSKCSISQDEKIFWGTLKRGNNSNIYVVKENVEPIEDLQLVEETDYLDDEGEITIKLNKTNQQFVCDYCQKKFNKKHYLKLHMFTHIQHIKTKREIMHQQKFLNDPQTNVLFEQVLIEQEESTGEEILYDAETTAINQFQCCESTFDFTDLVRHQFTDHIENFHMMIVSMKKEILNAMSVNHLSQIVASEYHTTITKNESIDFQGSVGNNLDGTRNINVECFICEEELPVSYYEKHLSSVHPLEDAVNAKKATCKFICNYCSESFGTISLCVNHLKKTCHENTANFEHRKVFTCETCKQTFKFEQSLKIHRLQHREMKPAYCSICGYTTVTQTKMDKHMVEHELQKMKY